MRAGPGWGPACFREWEQEQPGNTNRKRTAFLNVLFCPEKPRELCGREAGKRRERPGSGRWAPRGGTSGTCGERGAGVAQNPVKRRAPLGRGTKLTGTRMLQDGAAPGASGAPGPARLHRREGGPQTASWGRDRSGQGRATRNPKGKGGEVGGRAPHTLPGLAPGCPRPRGSERPPPPHIPPGGGCTRRAPRPTTPSAAGEARGLRGPAAPVPAQALQLVHGGRQGGDGRQAPGGRLAAEERLHDGRRRGRGAAGEEQAAAVRGLRAQFHGRARPPGGPPAPSASAAPVHPADTGLGRAPLRRCPRLKHKHDPAVRAAVAAEEAARTGVRPPQAPPTRTGASRSPRAARGRAAAS